MKKKKAMLLSVIFLLGCKLAIADNVVKLDSLIQYTPSYYSANLILQNQDTLSGFQIPMTFCGTGATVLIDSASFDNSTVSNLPILRFRIDSTGHGIYVFGVTSNDSTSMIYPSDYQVCKIYFNAHLTDSTGTIMVQNSPWTVGKNHISFKLWKKGAVEVPSRFEAIPLKLQRFDR